MSFRCATGFASAELRSTTEPSKHWQSQWHASFNRLVTNQSADPAAAENSIAGVKDDCLAWSGGELWLVEGHFDSVVGEDIDFCRRGAVAVSDLSFAAEAAGNIVDQPVEPVAFQRVATELFSRADHHAASLRFEADDVTRFSESQAEPLALSDGEAFVAFVATEDRPDGVDDFARGILLSSVTFEEACVVVVRDETDLLTVGLVVNSESRLLSLLANIRFVEVSNWKDHPVKDCPINAEQNVRLIFAAVSPPIDRRPDG